MQELRRRSWHYIWIALKIVFAISVAGVVFGFALQSLGFLATAVLSVAVLTALLFSVALRLVAEQMPGGSFGDRQFLISMCRLFSAKLLIVSILLVCSLFTRVHWLSVALAIWLALVIATLGTVVWRQSKDAKTSPPVM